MQSSRRPISRSCMQSWKIALPTCLKWKANAIISELLTSTELKERRLKFLQTWLELRKSKSTFHVLFSQLTTPFFTVTKKYVLTQEDTALLVAHVCILTPWTHTFWAGTIRAVSTCIIPFSRTLCFDACATETLFTGCTKAPWLRILLWPSSVPKSQWQQSYLS